MRVVPERDADGNIKGYTKARWQTTPKKHERSDKTIARMRSKKIKGRKRSKSTKNLLSSKRKRISKTIGEWANLSHNVLDYVDIKVNGPGTQGIRSSQGRQWQCNRRSYAYYPRKKQCRTQVFQLENPRKQFQGTPKRW